MVKNRLNLYKLEDAKTSLETEAIEEKNKRSKGSFKFRTMYIHTKYNVKNITSNLIIYNS